MKLTIKDLSIESRQYVTEAIAECADRTGYVPNFGEVVEGILTAFRTMQSRSDLGVTVFAALSVEGRMKAMSMHAFEALESAYLDTSAALAKRIVAESPGVETAVRFLDKYAEMQELEAEIQALKAA